MKYSYYPGCTLRTKAKELDAYARVSAKALGFEDKKGLIKDGYDADLIIIDDDFNVCKTFVNGKCVYTA